MGRGDNKLGAPLRIYYDGECPFCSRYSRWLRLKENVGDVQLINAREDIPAQQRFAEQSMPLDAGMVVEYQGHTYHAEAAIALLAQLSEPCGLFNRLNHHMLRHQWLANLCYPLLRLGRNTALLLKNTPQMQATAPSPSAEALTLFSFLLGVFAVYHFLIYLTSYGLPLIATSFFTLILGIGLMLSPASRRLLVGLILCLLVDGILRMPVGSNHSIIKNFLILGMALTGLRYAILAKTPISWGEYYRLIAPLGRSLLLMMYFFGIFHKLNTDFLNPETSCAVTLLYAIELLRPLADYPWMQHLAIYGTYAVEGFAMIALLIAPLRYFGILAGIILHTLFAMSAYEFYPTFSTLALMLHALFLPSDALTRFKASQVGAWLLAPNHRLTRRIGMITFILAQCVASYYYALGQRGLGYVPWLVFAGGFLLFALAFGRETTAKQQDSRSILSKFWALNLVAVLFFLNGFAPYLGIKTRQSINMFANLQLEGGRSNHLLIQTPPFLNDRMNQIVEVTRASEGSSVNFYRQKGFQFLYYDLLNRLERERDATVSFWYKGTFYEEQSYATLGEEIDATLEPRWIRGLLQYNPITPTAPKYCSPFN